ncbi:MAG: hypothetical protein IT162_13580 [Bryobacterales bacterium]|nr:hypothetical protein [Bryobacterales bacterium]
MYSTFIPNHPPGAARAILRDGQFWLAPAAKVRSAAPAPPPAPALPEIPNTATAFATQTLAFPADPKQLEILASPSRRIAICCSRQWGKSTTAAIKALHHALTNPNSLTLIASRTLKQSANLLEKIAAFVTRTLGLPRRRVARQSESILLPNGAQIIATSGASDSSRGLSAVSLLVIDEAAYTPDALYHAFRPMLATQPNAAVWLLSTPNGRRGFFYEAFTSDRWAGFSVPATECPRISQEFLDEERRLHGPAVFKREYLCDFGATAGESAFHTEKLNPETATAPPPPPPPPARTVNVETRYIDTYLNPTNSTPIGHAGAPKCVGFDLGQRSSHSALAVIERLEIRSDRRNPVTFEILHETQFNLIRLERFPLQMSYDDTARRLKNSLALLAGGTRDITLLVDATGVGQPFLDILRKHDLGVHLMPIAITSGGHQTYSNNIQRVPKRDLIQSANLILGSEVMRFEPSLNGLKELREEMEAYRVKTSASGHERYTTATTDDLIMAFALAAWQARKFLPAPDGTPAASRPRPPSWILQVP